MEWDDIVMHTPQHMDSFKARVARIQNPRYTHYTDPESGVKIPRRVSRGEIRRKVDTPSGKLFMAALLGALCLMVARYLRMEVINVQPYFPDGLVAEMAMACMAAIVIGGFVKMQSLRTAAAQCIGALVCAVTMHNAVWVAPQPFAVVFSQNYVERILAETAPLSIHVNGLNFTLTI